VSAPWRLQLYWLSITGDGLKTAMTVRGILSEAIMLIIVTVIGGAVSLFIVTAFLLIMGQHTWLDNF
jgi:hypothetical protein